MKYTENIQRFEKKDNGGITLNKQYFYCLAYCYLHQVFKYTGYKNEDAMVNAGSRCDTNCSILYNTKLSHISMSFCIPFVKYKSRDNRFILPNITDGNSPSCNIEHRHKRGSDLYNNTDANDYGIIDNGENAIGFFRSSGRLSLRAHYYAYNFQHGTLDKVTCHDDGGQEYLDSCFQDNKPLRLSIVKFSKEDIVRPDDKSMLKKLQQFQTANDAYRSLFHSPEYFKLKEVEHIIKKYEDLLKWEPAEL